jgi:hypothetical protein
MQIGQYLIIKYRWTSVFVSLKLLEQGPGSEAEKKDKNRIIIRQVDNPETVQTGVIKSQAAS